MRTVTFVLGVILLAGAVVIGLLVFSAPEEPSDSSSVSSTTGVFEPYPILPSPSSSGSTEPPSEDFLKHPELHPYETPGYYYLGEKADQSTTTGKQPPYLITYISETNTFIIQLLDEPIQETRRAVEEYLLRQLAISEREACDLSYSLATSWRVNQHYAGKDLRFSFCSDAVRLPGD